MDTEMPTIWGKYKGNVERIDSCSNSEVGYLLGEYRLAFGAQWVLWAGRKKDEPGKEGDRCYGEQNTGVSAR
jgi:hypothetical protein